MSSLSVLSIFEEGSSLFQVFPNLLLIVIFQILHLKGDRKDFEFVKSSLSAEGFDVVYDINGLQTCIDSPAFDTYCTPYFMLLLNLT